MDQFGFDVNKKTMEITPRETSKTNEKQSDVGCPTSGESAV
jgi:hypothetical protein